jgi:hypothetical protein
MTLSICSWHSYLPFLLPMTGRAAQDEYETNRLARREFVASIHRLLLVGGIVQRSILDGIVAAPTVPPSINNRPNGSTGRSIIVGSSASPFLHGSKTVAALSSHVCGDPR